MVTTKGTYLIGKVGRKTSDAWWSIQSNTASILTLRQGMGGGNEERDLQK